MFPVEEKIDLIKSHLASGRDVVLASPPGSGKTTCVPPALLDEPWLDGGKIVMLEPRRIAARSVASYIAKKIGVKVGDKVGYQVRLEKCLSRSTRLEIITEGLLTQRILSDMELKGINLIIFDEFHERSLQTDLAFALILEIKKVLRPDLRIIVMSATLDIEELNLFLGGEIVVSEGKMFEVEKRYLGDISIVSAVRLALKETQGDILVFLPGEREIRNSQEKLSDIEGNIEILPLYGSLPKEEQDKVFENFGRRKVILSTSIAETSLTIPGIACVIDSGLMRVSKFSPATGMSALNTLPISLDRAIQRQGRAGRVMNGVCYKLWTETKEASLPRKALPEVLTADLCGLVLSCALYGALRRDDITWLTAPSESSWSQATCILESLGALEKNGAITSRGRKMAQLPMHPRLANMMLSGDVKAPYLAAVIEEGLTSRETDVRYVPKTARSKVLSKMFERYLTSTQQTSSRSEGALLMLAYPDRIARRRANGTYRMVNGKGAYFDEGDPLLKHEFLVCCKLDDRAGDSKVFLACPVTLEEIEAEFSNVFSYREICKWDDKLDRVKSVRQQVLGEMVIDEKPCRDIDPTNAFLDGIRRKGVENLPCWTKETLQLRSRINFLWQIATDEEMISAMSGFVSGMTKWSDLESFDIAQVLKYLVLKNSHTINELDTLAPDRIVMPTGSKMQVHYEGDEPSCHVRLQECFGMKITPTVNNGKTPVVMTLLSPAMRPCAVTKDLQGFWANAYSLVRKDLRGRYPKHYWPEDPFSAVPTTKVKAKM